MKISVICANLSSSAFHRPHVLASALKKYYEVEIIGPMFWGKVWEPLAYDTSIPIKGLEIKPGRFSPFIRLLDLSHMIDGDAVYVQKPLISGFGPGLLSKWQSQKPCLLDIDDWQRALVNGKAKWSLAHLSFYQTWSYWNAVLCERLIRYADAVTVTSTFLRKQFGGTVVPHGLNMEHYDPDTYDKNILRARYNLSPDDRVVLFSGNPRKHKGIDDLIEAVHRIADKEVILLLAGIDDEDPLGKSLIDRAKFLLGSRFRTIGPYNKNMNPEIVALSDLVVIPQQNHEAARAQVPAKLIDAMAMAKPIVATGVSDIPEILNTCGWIVPPEKPDRLAESIRHVLDNPREALDRGKAARKKAISHYSLDAIGGILKNLFARFETGNSL